MHRNCGHLGRSQIYRTLRYPETSKLRRLRKIHILGSLDFMKSRPPGPGLQYSPCFSMGLPHGQILHPMPFYLIFGCSDFPKEREIGIPEHPDCRLFRKFRNPISENPDFRESENPDFQISGLPNLRKSGFPEI